MHLLDHIEAIRAIGGPKKKIEYIVGMDQEELSLFKEYLALVYSNENWYQTKIKPVGPMAVIGKAPLTAIEGIQEFLRGERRGGVGESRLGAICARMKDPKDRELLKLAVWHDIKAGLGIKSINKVWPGLIFEPPYMRCSTLDKGYHLDWDWSKGVFVQNKEDQMFGNLVCKKLPDGTYKFQLFSRNWNEITSKSALNELFEQLHTSMDMGFDSNVVHGEIQVKNAAGEYLSRELSNGAVNGLIQTGEDLPEGYTIWMKVWDIIPLAQFLEGKFDEPYFQRYDVLSQFVGEISSMTDEPRISMVNSTQVSSPEEIVKIFKDIVEGRGEGVVIKNPDGAWGDSGGSKDMVKIKTEFEVDLEIIGFNEADEKSKHVDTFASLQCKSVDGKVITGVSGMTDAKRMELHMNRDRYMNTVVAVKCNGIQRNPQEPHSLYFAQFIEERLDKTVADDFDRIVSVQNSAIEDAIMSKGK